MIPNPDVIARLCAENDIRVLRVFGSATHGQP